MSPPAKKSAGKTFLKVAGIVLGTLLSLILIVSILLLTVLEPYAARYLKKQVSKTTNGLYQLEFERIHIDLFTTTLALHQATLSPDSAMLQQQLASGEAPTQLIALETTEFRIEGVNLIDALFRQKLSLNKLFIDQPELILSQYEMGDSVKQSRQKGGGRFQALEIGELEIREGSFRQQLVNDEVKMVQEVVQLSLALQGLALDFEKQGLAKQLFQTRSLELALHHWTYQLPDGVHRLSVADFSYSTRQASLQLQTLALQADEQANLSLPPDEASRLLFNLQLPAFNIDGFDVLEGLHSHELLIEAINLQRPVVEVIEFEALPSGPQAPALPEIWAALSPYLKQIYIDAFSIDDASFRYRIWENKEQPLHELAALSLGLQEIQLDSLSLFHPRKSFPFEDLQLVAREWVYRPRNNPHTLQLASLVYTREEQRFSLDSLLLQPNWQENQRLIASGNAAPLFYDLSLPGLRLEGFDPIRDFQTGGISLGSIELLNPALQIFQNTGVSAGGNGSFSEKDFNGLPDFLKTAAIGKLSIRSASLAYEQLGAGPPRQIHRLEKAFLQAGGLKLNAATLSGKKLKLPMSSLHLSAESYTHRQPEGPYTFQLGKLAYSSRSRQLEVHQLRAAPDLVPNDSLQHLKDGNRRLYALEAPRLRITDLDVIGALNAGRLAINQVVLQQPTVSVLTNRNIAPQSKEEQQQAIQGIFALLNPVRVQEFRLEEGIFSLHERREEVLRTQLLEKATLSISGIHLSPDKLQQLDQAMPFEEIRLNAHNYSYRSPDSIYTITLDSLAYSSRSGELLANRFSIASDKEMHQRQKRQQPDSASRHLVDLEAPRFRISGFDLLDAYETGNFIMAEMKLSNPAVSILQDRNVARKNEKPQETNINKAAGEDEQQAMGQLAAVADLFRVEQVQLENGNIRLNILEGSIEKSQEIARVDLHMERLRLDNLDSPDPLDGFSVADLELDVKEYSLITPDSLYELRLGRIRASLSGQELRIDSLNYEPLYEVEEHTKRLDWASDRVEIKALGIRLLGIDLEALFEEQELLVEKLLIMAPVAEIFRDNRLEQNPERRPPTLQGMLRNAGIPLTLDSVVVQNGKFTYSEISPTGVEPGHVILDELLLRISNVTNDSTAIAQNSTARAFGSTLFLEESILSVDFEFQLDHPDDRYTYKGQLEPMPFEAFNPLIENLMFVRLESGQLKGTAFAVEANRHLARGSISFPYRNLELQLIDKEDKENPGFMLNAGSWLLNRFVIKTNNPSRIGIFRCGAIETERDYSKSVFNHMSKAMFNGIGSSLMPALVEKAAEAVGVLP